MLEADRHSTEKDFWDKRASDAWKTVTDYRLLSIPTFEDLGKDIAYLRSASRFFGDLKGRRIVDLGCGDGWLSWSLAKSGGLVSGCDISPKSIELAQRVAQANGIGEMTDFQAMPCESLTYPDDHFDCVLMHAAMHHCDIEKVTSEIWRVLKPGGKAVLVEDYAYHPFMRLYRRLTPHGHTPDEEALTDQDIARISSKFSHHDYKYFGLLDVVETSQNPVAIKFKPFLRTIDELIYRWIPVSTRWSKLVQIHLIK